MKFIRDIISEKRAVKQASMAMPSAVRAEERFEAPDPEPSFRNAYDAAPRMEIPQAEPVAAEPRNVFAFDDEVGQATPVEALADPEGQDDMADADDWNLGEAEEAGDLDAANTWPEAEAALPPEPQAALAPLYLEPAALTAARQPSPFDRLKASEAEREEVSIRKPGELFQRAPREEPAPRLAAQVEDRIAVARSVSPISAPPQRHFAEDRPVQRDLGDMPFVSVHPSAAPEEVISDAGIQVPPPAAGRGSNRSGRVKTRLLGFNPETLGLASPFEKPESRPNDAFPVAWLVVVAGPGRGASFPLHDGVARIGRGEDQTVCLNFGDNSISRENHVSVAYDSEQNAFFIGQSGRSNIVRLNNKPLLSTEQIRGGDQIRVGETTLRLVALCDEGFSWNPRA